MELINVKHCEFCGKSEEDTRIIKSKFGTLCRKHYLQMYKHGEIKRTIYDNNRYEFNDDEVKIYMYDKGMLYCDKIINYDCSSFNSSSV